MCSIDPLRLHKVNVTVPKAGKYNTPVAFKMWNITWNRYVSTNSSNLSIPNKNCTIGDRSGDRRCIDFCVEYRKILSPARRGKKDKNEERTKIFHGRDHTKKIDEKFLLDGRRGGGCLDEGQIEFAIAQPGPARARLIASPGPVETMAATWKKKADRRSHISRQMKPDGRAQ